MGKNSIKIGIAARCNSALVHALIPIIRKLRDKFLQVISKK